MTPAAMAKPSDHSEWRGLGPGLSHTLVVSEQPLNVLTTGGRLWVSVLTQKGTVCST